MKAALAAILAVTAMACGGSGGDRSSGAPDAAGVRDAAGRLHPLGDPPRRIVSLVPSATEILVAVGVAETLVGRTDYDTLSALAELPSVGGGLGPSMEVLLSLEPDLVVRFVGDQDTATPERLDALGIPHFAVGPERIEDVRDMIAALGTLVGRPRRADSLVAGIDRGLAAVRVRVAGRPPVRAAFVLEGSPPWAAGPDTFVDELITLAGGENVFHDLDRRWSGVSPEALLDRDIDVVLMLEGAELDPRLAEHLTVRHVSSAVQLPGPHLDEAAWDIARALHPDIDP